MYEYLARFSPWEMIVLVSIVGGLFVIIFAVGADVWQRVRKAEIETKLKQDMLDRGMSADEIRTVLDAGKSNSFSKICDSIGQLSNRARVNR
jgi:hypothetical protein